MSQIERLVNELVSCGGSAAPEMTHSLKVLGHGDMATGLKRFGGYLFSCGYTKGELSGVLKGSLSTLSAGLLALVVVTRILDWMKSQRELKEEHTEIINALREASAKKEGSDTAPVDRVGVEGEYGASPDIIETTIEGGSNDEETI